jgi:hypothetical protein
MSASRSAEKAAVRDDGIRGKFTQSVYRYGVYTFIRGETSIDHSITYSALWRHNIPRDKKQV